MKPIYLALATTTLAASAIAQDTRELDAHVHGVSTVEIAIKHGAIEINLLSPGMDISASSTKRPLPRTRRPWPPRSVNS
ncbi:hypothetical protein [Roseovarius sp.]|uniref:hypothetical protein n=1 Tax=Roseovarius sp. TaxID=1486281 RepID=UPI003B5CE7E9